MYSSNIVSLTSESHVTTALSIRCWVCRSDSDPKCADPFDNKTLPITDCDIMTAPHLTMEPLFPGGPRRPIRATMCRKTRQKVNGHWTTIRDCAFLGQPGEGKGTEHHCLIRQGTYDVYMEHCTCNSKDGCNTGTTTTPVEKAFILMSTITTFLIYYCIQ